MIYPDTERFIYNNEIFSLLGLLIYIGYILNGRLLSRNLGPLHLFILYGFIVVFFSLPDIAETGLYLSLRTMAIWYSVFAFFLGFIIINRLNTQQNVSFIGKFRLVSWVLMFISNFRLTPHVLLAFGRTTALSNYLFLCSTMLVYFAIKGGATTVTAIITITAIYAWANTKLLSHLFNKKSIFASALVTFGSLYFLLPLFEKFTDVGYAGFGIDNNMTWRIMFWLYLFKEQFLDNPLFGLGFGSKLFDLATAPDFITADDGSRFTEYTLGTHNSFFYAAIRLGGVGFVLLIASVIKIYTASVKAYRASTNHIQKNLIFSLILANALFLNSALFNVVLESPLYAANFWFTLGAMHAFIRKPWPIKNFASLKSPSVVI